MTRFLRSTALACLLASLLVLALLRAAATEPAKPPATAEEAALAWLALVDSGGYAESFEAASPHVREKATLAQWIAGLERMRGPLGPLVSRRLERQTLLPEVLDGPKGHYIALLYTSRFERAERAGERVTCFADASGWRVLGYSAGPLDALAPSS